ncbi:MAG: hypothetical protein JW876_07130 [Candidatus Krumholzibacteriota bacterium]|nr:hypothetical protein [Candidatus Krumholzibacteriota bacterium]
MTRRSIAVPILLALVAAALPGAVADAVAAERALLLRPRGVGVGEDLIDAATLLFHGALEREGVFLPVSADEIFGPVVCWEADCAASLAADGGFSWAIAGSMTRLGGKIIVRTILVAADGEGVASTAEGTAATEEDLDVVVARLAKSLSTGRSMERTAEVGMITEREYEEPRRRGSYKSRSFRVGYLWPTGDSMGGANRLLAIDFGYQYDTGDWFLSGRSGVRWGGDLEDDGGEATDIALFDAKIGRFLSRSDFSPFVNAGLGLHWVREKARVAEGAGIVDRSDSGTGIAIVAGAGFTAFRTYDFSFQIDVDAFVVFEELETGGHPAGILFTFCVMHGEHGD